MIVRHIYINFKTIVRWNFFRFCAATTVLYDVEKDGGGGGWTENVGSGSWKLWELYACSSDDD